ncbi:hypothetical protein HXX76_000209 [Chlamydomonas incerta]|uniref:Protein kinase domain-containing protein n=1 Tax=Chlamydomonas incerta TaxID=51695 RepID=A0A836B2M2_CHLIN|nr:hypothetical protein HXX76_000209 [Chlamydomonas incerta]|eukprot:KAG2445598.1 hypothetical protein HXX76_000209 [Chlamydomonas incerta]
MPVGRRERFRALQALTLLAAVLVNNATAAASGECSAVGGGTPSAVQALSSLSAGQVAQGALATPITAKWDFEGRPNVLAVPSGTAVSLSCLTALNATVAAPSAAAGSVFLQPTALDLSAASGLSMAGVSLSTDCGTVLAYQQYLCTSLRAAGSLTMDSGVVRFSRWRDGFTSLDNVTLTCPTSAGVAAAAAPCRLVSVQTATELLEAFTVHAAAAAAAGANLTVVLAGNVTVPRSSWPTAPVLVPTNMSMVGSTLLSRPVLDLAAMTKMWDLVSPNHMTIAAVTLVNLAPTYFSPGVIFSQFGMLSERVWAFRRSERLLHLVNATLVVPTEQLAYTKYWVTFLVSPVPEAQEKAAWIRVGGMKVGGVNATGVYYDSAIAYTVTYLAVRITDTMDDPGYPLVAQYTGVRSLRADNVPLTSANPANGTRDLQAALDPANSSPDDLGRRWVLLANNISLAEPGGSWPSGAAAGGNSSRENIGSSSTVDAAAPAFVLGSDFVITRGGGQAPMQLGLGLRGNALGVPYGVALVLRQLVLSELAARGSSYSRSDPLAVLSSPLWGVSLAAGASKTQLINCTLVVSAEELWLLQQSLLPAEQLSALARVTGGNATANSTGVSGSPRRPFDSALAAGARAFFTAADDLQLGNATASRLVVVRGTTARYAMSNVTFRVPDGGEKTSSGLTALGVPYDDGSSSGGASSSGTEPWVIGVAVGCAVGGALLLVAAGALLVVQRRRRRGQQQSGKDACPTASAPADGMQQGGGWESSSVGMQTGEPGAAASGADCLARELAAKAGDVSSVPNCSSLVGLTSSTLDNSTTATAARAAGALGASTVASGPAASAHTGGQPSISLALSAGATTSTPYTASSAAVVLAAGGYGVHADSFDQAGTTSMIGAVHQSPAAAALVAAAFRSPPPSNTQSQKSGFRDAGSAGVPSQGSGPAMGSGVPSGDVGPPAASDTSVLLSSVGCSSLEQMRGIIAALGRDLADNKQLVVHGLIGKGAHGTVYRGTWRGLPVAVKSMVFGSDDHTRHQQRPLMEAAISSNLVHPNIVTTYSYELREVQHELASLSPDLSQQRGGWRLLIIQEFCDAGPLRRLADCGFFLTPPTHSTSSPSPAPSRAKLTPSDTSSQLDIKASSNVKGQGDGSISGSGKEQAAGSSGALRDCNRAGAGSEAAADDSTQTGTAFSSAPGGAPTEAPVRQQSSGRPPLEDVPADVAGGRPASSLQAALRYVEAALQIARGLQHIHDKNIVHGDLNPNNVLLMRAPGTALGFCLKVSDFGLSVRVGEGQSHLSNLFQGTPYYCAPEVLLSGKIGKSADLYSLGIMLWELQNGTRPPWRMGVRLRTYPSLNTGELEFGPDTPPRYARLARECFHASSAVRPSVESVVAALERLKEEVSC